MVIGKSIYGIEPIYTNKKPDSVEMVIEILGESLLIHNKNVEYALKNTLFHNGITQEDDIPDTGRKYNVKITSNKIMPIIENLVSLVFSEPMYYSLFKADDPEKKKDLEIISNYLKIANEHQRDCDTLQKTFVAGASYRLTSSVFDENKPKGHLPFGLDDINECIFVKSYEVGHPTVITYIVSRIENVTRVIAYTDTLKYILESDTEKFRLVEDVSSHYLGVNPIQEYRNGQWGISLVSELKGNQSLINILKSSMVNDTLLFVNKLLLLFGVEITEKILNDMKTDNVLAFPGEKDVNYDGKYIETQLNNEGNKAQIEMAQEDMLFIASVPTQNVGRSETGEAAKTANGSTLADFNGDRIIRRFIEPKRQQLKCIIAIMRKNGYLQSDIQDTDIEIKFDNNRLISSIEMIRVVIELIKSGADTYQVCKMFNIASDNTEFAKLWNEGIEKIKQHEIDLKESGRTIRTAPLVEKTTEVTGG